MSYTELVFIEKLNVLGVSISIDYGTVSLEHEDLIYPLLEFSLRDNTICELNGSTNQLDHIIKSMLKDRLTNEEDEVLPKEEELINQILSN